MKRFWMLALGLVVLGGCTAGPELTAKMGVANSLEQIQLEQVRTDLRKYVNAYDADLRAAYRAHARTIVEKEVALQQAQGTLTPESLAAVFDQAEKAIAQREATLDTKRAEFETNENLEDAILLNQAEGRGIRTVNDVMAEIDALLSAFSIRPKAAGTVDRVSSVGKESQ